jgi:thymidylate synthase (FAD)
MNKTKLLDHGYLGLVESWGSDERVIEAARMSTGKGFQGWGPSAYCAVCGFEEQEYTGTRCKKCGPNCFTMNTKPGDEKLLAYLYANKHATPFEFGGMVIEVQAPIMVFREWHRHRTQSYNEMSARYAPLPDLNYIPTVERLMLNSKTNKQAGTVKDAEELTEAAAKEYQIALAAAYHADQQLYEKALRMGVPKELARIHLPVGRYSRMRASTNLRNWLTFLTLRMDEHAQWEIRQYANEVGKLIQEKFPRTWALFMEGR